MDYLYLTDELIEFLPENEGEEEESECLVEVKDYLESAIKYVDI